jgi:hypothetical protein
MTLSEFCDRTHLTCAQVYTLRAAGLIRPDLPASQVEFARLIKALQNKGAKLSQLARADLAGLAGLAGKAFVVFDGSESRACRDAVVAIATVVKAKRPCSAVDLSAIRTDEAE